MRTFFVHIQLAVEVVGEALVTPFLCGFNLLFEWYKLTQMTSCISLRWDDVIV